MIADEQIKKVNKIRERELKNVSSTILRSFMFSKNHRAKVLEDKGTLINDFIEFLSRYIESNIIADDKQRTYILNLIDKLTLQKELLQSRKDELNIKEAGLRLGKKSQSAFIKR
jgi:hypothetical protein